MNLIRNGGFERGNEDFWESSGSGAFSIDTGTPKHGVYCGLIEVNSGQNLTLLSKDYIPIRFAQKLFVSYYIKSDTSAAYRTVFYEYDDDLNLIATTNEDSMTSTGSYVQNESIFTPNSSTEYVRVAVYVVAMSATPHVRIDTCNVSMLEPTDRILYALEIADLSGVAASGNTSATPFNLLGFDEYYAEIDVTQVLGTTPTCDIEVCETDQYDNERVLGTFTQITAVTDQRVGIARPIGKGMYIKYVVSGTTPQFTFKTSVIGVR